MHILTYLCRLFRINNQFLSSSYRMRWLTKFYHSNLNKLNTDRNTERFMLRRELLNINRLVSFVLKRNNQIIDECSCWMQSETNWDKWLSTTAHLLSIKITHQPHHCFFPSSFSFSLQPSASPSPAKWMVINESLILKYKFIEWCWWCDIDMVFSIKVFSSFS